ncbi:MAG: hypothetical protein KKA81_02900, partial [Bacteroidetes bacterium]|nr:hypothetical protein [Bacteroidota bacterium]
MNKSAFMAFAGSVIILLASTMVSGRDIALQKGKETQTRVVSNTYEELLITQTIAEISTLKVRTEEGVFIQLNIPGFS